MTNYNLQRAEQDPPKKDRRDGNVHFRNYTGSQLLADILPEDTSIILRNFKEATLPRLPDTVVKLNIQYTKFPRITRIEGFPSNLTDFTEMQNTSVNPRQTAIIPSLPPLPASLKLLKLRKTGLTALPDLPDGLETLYVLENQLTTLPALPLGLQTLIVSKNPLGVLPNPLPPTLQSLGCSYCQLTSLPPLPPTITILDCGNNSLESFPPLPPALEVIYAQDNRLAKLPLIPFTMQDFNFDNNPLQKPYDWIYREAAATFMNPFFIDQATPAQKRAILGEMNKHIQAYEKLAVPLQQRQRNIRKSAANVIRLRETLGQRDSLGPNLGSAIGSLVSGKKGSLNQQLEALYQQMPEKQPAGVTQQPFVPPHIQRQQNAETRYRLKRLSQEEKNIARKTLGGKRRKRSGRKTRKSTK